MANASPIQLLGSLTLNKFNTCPPFLPESKDVGVV